MNIYLVEQDWNNDYDTFDSFVCIAENEQAARETFPAYSGEWVEPCSDVWISRDDIGKLRVTLIGTANEGQVSGIICASFNAG